jgi:hypothetical protein
MSKLKMYLVALAVIIASTASFANLIPEKKAELRAELSSFISKINFDTVEDEDGIFYVKFTVNSKKELIVLSTDNNQIDNRIKQELNYKELKATDVEINKVYTLPVRLDTKSS